MGPGLEILKIFIIAATRIISFFVTTTRNATSRSRAEKRHHSHLRDCGGRELKSGLSKLLNFRDWRGRFGLGRLEVKAGLAL